MAAKAELQRLLALISLVLINLAPLIGIMLFDWSALALLWFYWAENVCSGVANLPLIVLARGQLGKNLLRALLFVVHFGVFCGAHALVLNALLAQQMPLTVDSLATLWQLLTALNLQQAIYITLLLYLLGNLKELALGEIDSSAQVLLRPYKRMAILHISLLLGVVLLKFAAADIAVLALGVIIKIGGDIYSWRQARGHV